MTKEKAEATAAASEAGHGAEGSAEVSKLVDKLMKMTAEERKAFTTAYIGKLPVLELAEQVKALETAFGVSAAAPMAMMAPVGGAAGGGEAAAEEKTSFTVVLKEVGDKKIQVIKSVRAITNLGLKEAKAVVDGAPGKVKEGVTKDEAEAMKKELETSGAVVEIQ